MNWFLNKRIWIAISSENIAFQYKIVERFKIIQEVKKTCKEKANKNSCLMKSAKYGLNYFKNFWKSSWFFKKTFRDFFTDLEIILFDERLSSFEASLVNSWIWKKDDIAASTSF